MKGIFCGNGDINLFLTREEFSDSTVIDYKIVNNKLQPTYRPLECKLQKNDGSDSGRKARLQYENFRDMSDGIKLEYKEGTYFIRINEHASNHINERGYFGARYGNSQGITIYIPEQCNIYNNLYS